MGWKMGRGRASTRVMKDRFGPRNPPLSYHGPLAGAKRRAGWQGRCHGHRHSRGLLLDRSARSFQDRLGQSAFGWRCRLLPGDLALFNLAIDSKRRASDLVRLRVEDVCSGWLVRHRGVVIQRKTGRPVQ